MARGLVAPSILKKHPLTGEVLEPVGIVNGKYVWPICGGAPDDDDDDDDKDDGASGADDKKDKDADSGSASGGADDDGDKEDPEVLRRRLKMADKRADEALDRLKKLEDAKKDDLTKATERAEELEKTVAEKDSVIRELRLKNAFLSANKHSWHDPDEALASAERNGYLEDVVSDDDDGDVDKVRLGKALDRLAKEKPFLVKTEDKKDDEPGEPSGEPAGGRSDNTKDDKAKKEALRRRFPVLNR